VNDIGGYDNRRAAVACQIVVGTTMRPNVAMNAATARTHYGIAQRGGNDETGHVVKTPRVKEGEMSANLKLNSRFSILLAGVAECSTDNNRCAATTGDVSCHALEQ
jgi:hypothetical protein